MADIFISYRRGLDRHAAGRLHGELAKALGNRRIFMDVDDIPAGVDFESRLAQSVSQCKVLLAVIGTGWATVRDDRGRVRLFQSDDFVRIEISAALERGVRVVPVLIDAANMPLRQELPVPLHGLLRCQAVWLRHDRFSSDVLDLAKGIKGQIGFLPRLRKWIAQANNSSRRSEPREPPTLTVVPKERRRDALLANGLIAAQQIMSGKPQTDVERFVAEEVVKLNGSRLSATSLYEAYAAWCEARGREPLALPTFGRELAELGFQKIKKRDGVNYIGVEFRDQGGLEASSSIFVAQTHVQTFVGDMVVRSDGDILSASELYESYCRWCEKHKIEPLALPTFGRAIMDYQFQKVKTVHGVRYVGLALRDD